MSKYSRFIGTGSYYPSDVRTNADLEQMVDTSDEWITDRTGIKERRIIGADETAATMGAEASKKAIEMAGIDPKSIGSPFENSIPYPMSVTVSCISKPLVEPLITTGVPEFVSKTPISL